MFKKLIFCVFLALSPTGLWASAIAQKTSETVMLRLPPNNANMQYVKELLTQAYALIGYKISWVDISSAQELALVSKAKLASALARHPVIEQEFPELIKIPFKLFDFKLLKVSDRRRCGYCLDEDINSIIYAKGSRISAHYAQSLRATMDKLAIDNPQKLNQMILKRRVDSVLIMDFQLNNIITEDHHLIVETLAHEHEYHYLSPSYKYLKKPLINAFEQLTKIGSVASLQEKYKIKLPNKLKQLPEKITFISGLWLEYTNADGSGVYWNIIDSLFGDDFTITKNTSIWARAKRAFEQNQADILVGAYRDEKLSDVVYSSFHIDYEYPLYAFARNEDVLSRFKAQDKSLSVCLNSGSYLLEHIEFIPRENVIESSLAQCNSLINKGKVDVVIEYDYNLNQHTQALPKTVLIENSPLFLVFHDSPKGRALKSYFDENIAKLARDNVLQKIFPNEITYKQAHIRP
jgi:hypothetical protein